MGGQGEDHDAGPGLFRFDMCGSMVWVGGFAVVLGSGGRCMDGMGWGGLGKVRLGWVGLG